MGLYFMKRHVTLIVLGFVLLFSAQSAAFAASTCGSTPDYSIESSLSVMYLDDVGAFVAYDQLFMCTQIGILCDVVIFCTCDWDAEDCPITYVEDCWDEDEKMDCMVDDELCNWEEADPGGGGIQWGLNSYHCANEFCGEY